MIKKNRIFGTENDLDIIAERRQQEGFSRRDDSDALVKASTIVILRELEDGVTNLPIDWLTDQDSLLFDVYKRRRPDFTRFINQVKQRNNPRFTTLELEETLIEDRIIHGIGITYKNWGKFCSGESIPIDVFEAFCEALDLDDTRIEALRDCPFAQGQSKYEGSIPKVQKYQIASAPLR